MRQGKGCHQSGGRTSAIRLEMGPQPYHTRTSNPGFAELVEMAGCQERHRCMLVFGMDQTPQRSLYSHYVTGLNIQRSHSFECRTILAMLKTTDCSLWSAVVLQVSRQPDQSRVSGRPGLPATEASRYAGTPVFCACSTPQSISILAAPCFRKPSQCDHIIKLPRWVRHDASHHEPRWLCPL